MANGNKSIYLDCYKNGVREYEFLKLYLVPETTSAAKAVNAETLRLANVVKYQKIVEMQTTTHGFSMKNERSKMNFLDYVAHIAEQKIAKLEGDSRGGSRAYNTLHHHLRQYGGDKTTFKQVDKQYCTGFIDYLKTAKSTLNEQPLRESTQFAYMKLLETILNTAISDEIININPFRQIKPENKPKKRKAEIEYLTILMFQTAILAISHPN